MTVFGLKNGHTEEHIRALLQRFQYREQFKATAAFRVVFGGEEPSQVMADLDIHTSYTLRSGVSRYQRKVQTGLFVSPAMTRTQKRDVHVLQQRNDELEQAYSKPRRGHGIGESAGCMLRWPSYTRREVKREKKG